MQRFSSGAGGGLDCGRVNKNLAGRRRRAVCAAAAGVAALLAGAQLTPAVTVTLNNSVQPYTATPNTSGLAGQYYSFAQATIAGAEPTLSATTAASPNFTAPFFIPTYQSTLNTTVPTTLAAPNVGATIAYSNVNFGNPNASSVNADFGNLAPFNNSNGVGANNFGPVGFTPTDNITARWSGYIDLPAGVSTFATNSDDGSIVYIDGVRVVNNNQAQGNTRRIGQTANFAAAGRHEIVVAYYEGTGGAGMQMRYIPGVASTTVTDPAFVIVPLNVLSGPQNTPFVAGDDVVVVGGTTSNVLEVTNALNTNFSTLIFDATGAPATTTLTLKGSSARFTSTTFNGGTVNLLPSAASAFAQDFVLGALNDNAQAVTVQNDRNRIILDGTAIPNVSANTTFNIRGGGVILAGAAGGSNPAGAATINLSTPTVAGAPNPVLTLTSKTGNFTADNTVNVNENTAVEARQVDLFGTATVGAGNPVVALGGTNAITVAAGKTLTASSANTYTLQLNGGLSGAGNLTVTGGTVTLGPTAGAAAPVNAYAGATSITGGTLVVNTPISSTSGITITNAGVLTLNTTAAIDRAATVNTNGAVINYNANNAAGDNLLTASGTPAPNVTGRIVIGSAVTSLGGDTFNIGAFNTLTLPNTTVAGLIDRTGTPPNLTAAANAVIAQTTAGVNAAAAPRLGTAADLFFGFAANLVDNPSIGAGTPWKGLSNDGGGGRAFTSGTVNHNNTPFVIQSVGAQNFDFGQISGAATVNVPVPAGGSAVEVTFGGTNVRMVGGPVAANGGVGTADYSGISKFIIPSGVSTQFGGGTSYNVQGGANGSRIVPVEVRSGGTLNINGGIATAGSEAGALNGPVDVLAGGILLADDNANLNGPGAITLRTGSILQLGRGGQPSPFGIQNPTFERAVRVRLAENNIVGLDARVPDDAHYEFTGGDRSQNTAPNNVITLGTADGTAQGTLTLIDTGTDRTFNVTQINIGAGGGLLGAPASRLMNVRSNPLITGPGKLTIGATAAAPVDGQAKTGIVDITANAATFGIEVGSVDVVAGTLRNLSGGMRYVVGGGTGVTRVFSGATFASTTGTLSQTQLQLDAGGNANWTAAGPQIGGLQGAGNASIGNNTNATITLSVGANNLSSAFDGVISQNVQGTNVGNLTKVGAGTLTLNGNNTYRGQTTVSSGSLLVNGTHGTAAAPVGNYSVLAAAATTPLLGGNGTIHLSAGNTITAAGSGTNLATISPGTSIGKLTVNVTGAGTTGGVTFGDASNFLVETVLPGLAGIANDLLDVTGTGGNLSMATANDTLSLISTDPGTFTIAQYGGLRSGVFDNVTINGIAEPGTVTSVGPITTYTASSGDLTVVYDDTAKNVQVNIVNPVPEPGTAGLLAVAALGLLARRRRERAE